ncbi:hypothetical protein EON67_05455, partial [archaeon]
MHAAYCSRKQVRNRCEVKRELCSVSLAAHGLPPRAPRFSRAHRHCCCRIAAPHGCAPPTSTHHPTAAMYMRRRDAACTLLARCALLALCARNVASSVLAASQLENCISTSGTGGSTTCRSRFVLTLSVQNGQDSTESMTAYRMQQARDAEGNVYDILDEVEITLVKSQISLHYPLLYQRNYNNKPTELVRTRDTTGRGFNWLTNPCVDDADKTGACGWMLDSAGQKIPSSNGFCCRCDFSDFVSGNAPAGSRGNLHCELFDSVDSQSAHCLRMDPLAYSAFT